MVEELRLYYWKFSFRGFNVLFCFLCLFVFIFINLYIDIYIIKKKFLSNELYV